MNIIACANFKPEIEEIFSNEEDVFFCFESCNCLNKQSGFFPKENFEPQETLIFGGYCLNKLSKSPEYRGYDFVLNDNCFYQLLNKPLIDRYLNNGSYLITKGWLLDWRKNIELMGFSKEIAREFWSVFPDGILLLNTDDKKDLEEIDQFSEFINKDISVIDVGLSVFENTVRKEYFRKLSKIEKEKNQSEKHLVRKEVSDYQLAFEFIHDIIELDSTEEVIKQILVFIQMLCGAENVIFAPHDVCGLNGWLSITEISESGIERIDKLINMYGNSSLKSKLLSDKNVIFIVLDYKGIKVGSLVIDNLRFPEFSIFYNDLFLRLSSLFSILIIDIRNFEKLKKDEETLKEKNSQLKTAQRTIIESVKFKELLIAKTSHEIRNPLSGIIGLSSQMRDEDDTVQLKMMASYIKEAADHILSIVDELLDYSKTSYKEAAISHSDFQIKEIIDAVIHSQVELIKISGIKIESRIEPELLRFYHDRHRIQQVIENLFINALKYSMGTHITIAVFEQNGLYLSVRDNGIGIDRNEVPHIFEPFYRGNETMKGTGLGLTIVKEIVDSMNGTINLSEPVDGGCMFKVFVPKVNEKPGGSGE